MTKGEQLEAVLNNTFKQLENITDVREMTNVQLKKLVQKIEVDKDGKCGYRSAAIRRFGIG